MSVEIEPDKYSTKYWQGVRTNEDGYTVCRFREQDFNRDMEAWINRKSRVKLLEKAIISLVGHDALVELDKMADNPNFIGWASFWMNHSERLNKPTNG